MKLSCFFWHPVQPCDRKAVCFFFDAKKRRLAASCSAHKKDYILLGWRLVGAVQEEESGQ